MDIRLSLYTPLWTGDIDRNSQTLAMSGLIGSLRWWMEGIVRGLGGYACSPTGDHRCESNSRKPDSAKLCPVCRVFGCTGLSKSFQLDASELETLPLAFVSNTTMPNTNWLNTIYGGPEKSIVRKSTVWATKDNRIRNEIPSFVLKINPEESFFSDIRPSPDEIADILYFVIDEATRLGGIGAKTHHGFGQAAIVDRSPEVSKAGYLALMRLVSADSENARKEAAQKGQSTLFTLDRNRFFSKTYRMDYFKPFTDRQARITGFVRPGDKISSLIQSNFIPCSYDIRYHNSDAHPGLRQYLFRELSSTTRNWVEDLMGPNSKTQNKSCSTIHISHLYRDRLPGGPWILKFWGYARHKDLYGETPSSVIDNAINGYMNGLLKKGHIRRYSGEK